MVIKKGKLRLKLKMQLKHYYKVQHTTSYIKILGVKWLLESFCPAETFVTADKSVSRSPNISYTQPLGVMQSNDSQKSNIWKRNHKC
jgi:hypothetical protein